MTEFDLDRQIEALYGRVDWARQTGVVHVAAIASAGRRVIALGEAAPSSVTDRRVLGFVRARADAILTTGAILRSEPDLVHRYAEDAETDRSWRDWRREVVARDQPPALIVLSGSGDFPLDHPALLAAERGCIWTSPKGRDRLGAQVGALVVEVAEDSGAESSSGAAGALAWARSALSAETIAIEAGPTTSETLYADTTVVGGSIDELLLSCFEGVLRAPAIGPPFVSEEVVEAALSERVSSTVRQEASGTWRFERYRRALRARSPRPRDQARLTRKPDSNA